VGKKRIVRKTGGGFDSSLKTRALSRVGKRKVAEGLLHVRSTYNNTTLLLTDVKGDALCWSTSGALGFKGARKGTPFAAAKVGEVLGDKALLMGIKEVRAYVNGVGSGRESSIRAFVSRGITLTGINDITPIPHNGPRPRKPRRV